MDLVQNKPQVQNKIAGWALLFLGLAVILWSMYSSFEIFTGKTKAPEIFAVPSVSETQQSAQTAGNGNAKVGKIDPAKLQNLNPADLQNLQNQQQAEVQSMLENSITQQFEKLIPADLISKLMNLSSWSIFAFIMIYAGSKISSLGIKLLKD